MKPGRNALCPCDIGKKHKKCCGQHRYEACTAQSVHQKLESETRNNDLLPDLLTAAYIRQLVALFNAGGYGELERQARKLIIQYPSSSLVWRMLGVSLGMQGKDKDALQALERAATLRPSDTEARFRLVFEVGSDYTEVRNPLGIGTEAARPHRTTGSRLN